MSAELSARRTAAAAVLAGFRAAGAAFERGQRDQPAYASWAFRLASELASLLQRLDQETGEALPAGGQGARQLEEIRLVFGAFDWETDDRQYALEQIEQIVNGDGR